VRFFGKKGRIRRIGLAVLLGLAVAYFATPPILRHVVKSRLRAMISDQLDADLEIDGISYKFPYSVDVANASLVAHPTATTPAYVLMHVSHVSIELAQSPLRSGPLVIESVLIEDPSVHLIKSVHGMAGARTSPATPHAPRPKGWKLSQMFRLHRLALRGGKAVYEDRTLEDTVPLVWDNLNFNIDTVPLSDSAYGFHLVTRTGVGGALDALGTADIDDLLLHINRGTLNLSARPDGDSSTLPPEIQQVVRRMNVRGALVVTTIANIPLKELSRSTYDTTVELRDGAIAPPRGDAINKITAKLRVHDESGKPSLSLTYVNAVSGAVDLRLEGGSMVLDPKTLEWKMSGLNGHLNADAIPGGRLTGEVDFVAEGSAPLLAKTIRQFRGQLKITPKQLRTVPHLFPDPIDQFTEATLTLADGKVNAKQLRAAYGDDVWFVKNAEVDLTSLPREIVLSKFEGCLTFSALRHKYPAQVEPVLAQLNPVGPFFIDAADVRVPLAAPQKTVYHAKVHTPHGRLTLNHGRIPVYNINTEIDLVPGMARVEHFDAASFQGELHVTGWAQPGRGGAYDFNAKVDGVELHELIPAVQKPGARPVPIRGRPNVVAHVYGVIPAGKQSFLNAFRADGAFAVENGDFWQIPLFQDLARSVDVKDALTLGDAFGDFSIARQVVHLDPVAVSAPVLGVQGTGDITFDQHLNLDLVAIPGQVGKTNGKNVIGNGLAYVQQAFALASKTVLYKVHIGGALPDHYKIDPKLAAKEEIGGLIDRIKGKQSQ
jgi:hypothetical protein